MKELEKLYQVIENQTTDKNEPMTKGFFLNCLGHTLSLLESENKLNNDKN